MDAPAETPDPHLPPTEPSPPVGEQTASKARATDAPTSRAPKTEAPKASPAQGAPPTEKAAASDSTTEQSGPSGARLLATSLAAFVGIVMLGGVIGVILETSAEPPANLATAAVGDLADATENVQPLVAGESLTSDPELVDAIVVDATIAPTTVAPTTAVPTTAAPTTAVPTTAAAPTTQAPETSTSSAPPTSLVQGEEEPVETVILQVVERGPDNLALTDDPEQDEADDSVDAAHEVSLASPVEFVELPKAVYDRFSLRPDDSFSINIAANDKIGGVFESVELTGLGELAPGFALNSDGTLSGTATVCGNWRAQYALNSTNPAIGTSWIEITVDGCTGA